MATKTKTNTDTDTDINTNTDNVIDNDIDNDADTDSYDSDDSYGSDDSDDSDDTDDSEFKFQPKQYTQFLRSASANRAATFAQLYDTTLDYVMFREHAENLVLFFSSMNGVDTTTISLVSLIEKLPKSAYVGIEAKAKLNVQAKPSLNLAAEFAKLLMQFLTAFVTVSKYCKVS